MKKNALKMFTACAAVCLTAGLIVAAGGDAKADEEFSVEYNFEDGSYNQDDIYDLGITTEVVEGINSDVGEREYGEAPSTGNKALKITNRAKGKNYWHQNGFAYDLTKLTPGVYYDVKIDIYHENDKVMDGENEKYGENRAVKIGTKYEGSNKGTEGHPAEWGQIGNLKAVTKGTWERFEGTIKIPDENYAESGKYFMHVFFAYPEPQGSNPEQQAGYSVTNVEDYYIDNFSIKPHVDATPEPSATPEPTPTTAPTAAPAATNAPAAPEATPYVYVDTEEDTWMEKGYEAEVKGITYVVNGDGVAEVKESEASKVNIPATVVIEEGTYKVTSIANNAFKGNTDLKQLTIGANVTKIGKNAFYGCKNLKKITIKSKVLKTISAKAFKKTNAKAVVTVPKAKKAAYKKMLKKAGLSAKAKIK